MIGEAIQQQRVHLGWSRAYTARKAHVSVGTVARVERSNPSTLFSNYVKVAHALGLQMVFEERGSE